MASTMKYLSLSLLICLYSCNNSKASSSENTTPEDTITRFTMPAIPALLTQPEARADFLVKYYWDAINFADTNYIHHPEVMEQAWADYCDILNHVPLATAQQAIKATLIKAEVNKKMYQHVTDLADKYLYDPNSPLRNEEFYIPVLEAMTASPVLDDVEKIRPEANLKLAYKNRKGTQALNFTYTLDSGAKGTLHKLKAPYTILFINNPGCHACEEATEFIKASTTINKLIAEKKVVLLALYTDEELDEWKRHRGDFPTEWINGYDKELTIKTENLYDLRAIPSLYLLDKDKMVLLKDMPAQVIEEYLATQL